MRIMRWKIVWYGWWEKKYEDHYKIMSHHGWYDSKSEWGSYWSARWSPFIVFEKSRFSR